MDGRCTLDRHGRSPRPQGRWVGVAAPPLDRHGRSPRPRGRWVGVAAPPLDRHGRSPRPRGSRVGIAALANDASVSVGEVSPWGGRWTAIVRRTVTSAAGAPASSRPLGGRRRRRGVPQPWRGTRDEPRRRSRDAWQLMVWRRIPVAVCVRLNAVRERLWPAQPSVSRSEARAGGGEVAATTKDASAYVGGGIQQLLHERGRRSLLPHVRAHAPGGGQQPGQYA